ncbi:DUF1127 domain-containing protein [Roseovarius sp. 2305UL8-3]|uniref:DUF1127 domain-containing protein n=1 Tax=Roseovarius conchicola TaxID=3121636 RepID=UPI0035293D2A
MTFAPLTQSRSNALTLTIAETLNKTVQRIQDYRNYRITMDELSSLSSAQLADMGLHRSEIKRAAREAVYGAET